MIRQLQEIVRIRTPYGIRTGVVIGRSIGNPRHYDVRTQDGVTYSVTDALIVEDRHA